MKVITLLFPKKNGTSNGSTSKKQVQK